MSNTPTQEPQYRAVTAYTIPLPPHVGEESHGPSQSPVKLYDADQLHAHAAAVSAERDAEIAQLRADNTRLQNEVVMPLRERVKVLEAMLTEAESALRVAEQEFADMPTWSNVGHAAKKVAHALAVIAALGIGGGGK